MTTVHQYRLRCTTDSTYEYSWNTIEPITCPTNTAHTIDSTQTTIIESICKNELAIKEESTPTGTHSSITSLKLCALKNVVTSESISWPHPISALSMEFVSEIAHTNDLVSVSVGKNTITGSITANIAPASTWVSQNYTTGQIVVYNNKLYTCTLNTISNEVPTNVIYWKSGFQIPVSQAVIDNIRVGYYVNVDDGTRMDNLNRVISIDTVNDNIYMESNPTNSFLAATPTYIKQTIYSMKDYELGPSSKHKIGKSKIGGNYIPANTSVTIDYNNISVTTDKKFIGIVEFLY
jgi:hypothetical protein